MKKTRLLEIIREEIVNALRETDSPEEQKAANLAVQAEKAKIAASTKRIQNIQKGNLEEDLLNETPIYDISDMEGFKSTLDKFREEGVSKSKALNLLLKKLEDEGTVDTNALSKEYGVDTATFNNQEIRKFLNRPEDQMFTDKSGNELIDFSPFLDKSNKPKGPRKKEGDETTSEPKEKTALPDSGVTKKATLTKGDDGFDTVTYSKPEPKKAEPKKVEPKAEPKKAEPKAKESSEDKANKAAAGGSKMEKISNDKDALLKALKKAGEERLKIAQKRKETQDEGEKAKLFDDLKKINKLEGELQKKIDKLGY
jgi:hypothetical protein